MISSDGYKRQAAAPVEDVAATHNKTMDNDATAKFLTKAEAASHYST